MLGGSAKVRGPMGAETSLPPPVAVDLVATSMLDYWRARAAQHTQDTYAGLPMSKFPEDLRTYEHLLWLSEASAVIELGTWQGASALWFRDRLTNLARYRQAEHPLVVSIDVDITTAEANLTTVDQGWRDSIMLIEGDVRDPMLAEEVADRLSAGARCMVVEDSAHTYHATWAALQGFSRFVPAGGFMVVEDGCVDIDEMRISQDWPRGVLPAVADWLHTEEAHQFVVRRDLELYGLSCHPRGFLQRVAAA
jgi:cephalosporin hydroxylase